MSPYPSSFPQNRSTAYVNQTLDRPLNQKWLIIDKRSVEGGFLDRRIEELSGFGGVVFIEHSAECINEIQPMRRRCIRETANIEDTSLLVGSD